MRKTIMRIIYTMVFLLAASQSGFLPSTVFAADRIQGSPFEDQAIPGELKAMDVKAHFIPARTRPVGFVQTIQGYMVVIHGGTDQAFFAAQGDRIFRNDILLTLKKSRCRVKFDSADLIAMGQDTRIDIDEMIDDRRTKRKSSVLSMLRGKAMFYVVRLFRYKKTTARVKTPTAICGVRGTKFGIEIIEDEDQRAQSRPLYLADASDSGLSHILAANPGGKKVIFHGFGGTLFITPNVGPTKTIGDGESVSTAADGIGEVYQTPSGKAKEFTAIIKGSAGSGTGNGGGDDDPAGIPDTQPPLVPPEPEPPEVIVPSARPAKGYFTGMLTDWTSTHYLDNVYVSSSLQDFNSAVVRADGLVNGEGFIDGIPGGENGVAHLKQVAFQNAVVSADNLNLPVITNEIGYNDYMRWGKWHVPSTFIINSIVHDLCNTGYYVVGYPTPDANIAGIIGTYSGDAWGTYWNATNGIDMTGSFSCDVNGPAGSIDNFVMTVSGSGGKSAFISGADGTFNSTSFVLDTGSGSWGLSGGAPGYKACYGSLYGPNGEHIGGGWAMKVDSDDGATGIFKGCNSGPQ